jgi:2-alkyl-3-oxoalkanoate reductase
MTTIAVTGASGFVGGRISRYFAARGYKVLAYGRRSNPFHHRGYAYLTETPGVFKSPFDAILAGNNLVSGNTSASNEVTSNIEYTRWDITAKDYICDEEIAAVVHCAGSVSDWGAFRDMYRVNVEGTCNVLKAFPKAKLFVQISSASVYDPAKAKYFVKETEPYPAKYMNAYAQTKMLAELAVKESEHPNKVILRPHIIYGAGDTTVLPRLLRARRFGKFLIIGNGENNLSLTFVENLCYAIELLIGKSFGFEIFNIADAKTDSVNNILQSFKNALGIKEETLHINRQVALAIGKNLERIYKTLQITKPPLITPYIVAQMAQEYTLDIAKAKNYFGYDPPYIYEDGFKEVAESFNLKRLTKP